jgi:hypothetical protein
VEDQGIVFLIDARTQREVVAGKKRQLNKFHSGLAETF